LVVFETDSLQCLWVDGQALEQHRFGVKELVLHLVLFQIGINEFAFP
jgi:hypothetical protein